MSFSSEFRMPIILGAGWVESSPCLCLRAQLLSMFVFMSRWCESVSSSSFYQVQMELLKFVSFLFKNQVKGFKDARWKWMLRGWYMADYILQRKNMPFWFGCWLKILMIIKHGELIPKPQWQLGRKDKTRSVFWLPIPDKRFAKSSDTSSWFYQGSFFLRTGNLICW